MEKISGVYCTEAGIKLLEQFPNFIDDYWLNPECREILFAKPGKTFTKINTPDQAFFEKTGTDHNELNRYKRMAELMTEYKHIRLATTYFGTDEAILLEYYPHRYDPKTKFPKIKPNSGAGDELYDILLKWIPMSFCIEENGDLIVVDPHY